jgi:short-subunit dehydrogenase
MLLRKGKKSGIINVASFAGELPCIYFNLYGATKAFLIHFTKGLKLEYPEIDIMALNPSEVSTNMTFNKPTDIMTITAE